VSHHSLSILAGVGPEIAHIPVWEVVIVLGLAAAAIVVAFRGQPQHSIAPMPQSDEAAVAVVGEIQGVDRGLSVHANGVLTLSAIAAGGFGTIIQMNGGPGLPLVFATTIALLTGITLGAIGFAIEGGATGAAALSSDQLRACVERELRRAHRRLQCVRVATWCLIPIIILVVVGVSKVRR
jgi:hypothetical protein